MITQNVFYLCAFVTLLYNVKSATYLTPDIKVGRKY